MIYFWRVISLGLLALFCQGCGSEGVVADRFDGQPVSHRNGEARTYHVDMIGGDDAHTKAESIDRTKAWRTLGRAADAVQPGDVVLVHPGVYRETLTLRASGASGRPITFRAADRANRPVISGSDLVPADAWRAAVVTNFQGRRVDIIEAEVEATAKALYRDGERLLLAQFPDQSNPDDPYNVKRFLSAGAQQPGNQLVGLAPLAGQAANYWAGATVLLRDTASNIINAQKIVGSTEPDGTLIVANGKKLGIGNRGKESLDAYAIRNHIGVLDQVGEYMLESAGNQKKAILVVDPAMPRPSISVSKRSTGISVARGVSHVRLDGFVINNCNGNAISMTAKDNASIQILNCELLRNGGSGLQARFVEDIVILDTHSHLNHNNGFSFANADGIDIQRCEIDRNGDNGIWIGCGQPGMFNCRNVRIADCYFHDTTSSRRHPDNFQMHQVDNITIERCRFEQSGHQNMWCQYSDHYTLRNNVFINGRLGINSSIHCDIVHNVFYNSGLRFDRHLTNHPQNKDAYKPQAVRIVNNVLINSSMAWPSSKVVDRFEVFTVDHNFYAPIDSNAGRSWDWNGQRFALGPKTTLLTTEAVPVADAIVKATVSNRWSQPAGLIIGYVSTDDYYRLDLSAKGGMSHVRDGVATPLASVGGTGAVTLARAGPARGSYTIAPFGTGGVLGFTVTLRRGDESSTAIFIDRQRTASGVGVRYGIQNAGSRRDWVTLDRLELATKDGLRISDNLPADATNTKAPLSLTAITGSVRMQNRSGNGIGWGEGSLTYRSSDDWATNFANAPSPSSPAVGIKSTELDFSLQESSLLLGAGRAIGKSTDGSNVKDQLSQTPVPIGPYAPFKKLP